MTFTFECPHCGQHISATPADSGSDAACPSCSTGFTVPAAPDSAPSATEEAATKVALNAWNIFREAITAFMGCPGQMLSLAFVCIAIGAVLAWVPLIGVFWLYNAIGVIQQFAPRLAKGESWSRIWQNGMFKTAHDFNIGMKFFVQCFLVLLSTLPVSLLVLLVVSNAPQLRNEHPYVHQALGALFLFAIFYAHTRITFLPTMPAMKSATKAVFAATRGQFWRLAPITAIKWLLGASIIFLPVLLGEALGDPNAPLSILFESILMLILSACVFPFLGLVNDLIQRTLLHPTSNIESRNA